MYCTRTHFAHLLIFYSNFATIQMKNGNYEYSYIKFTYRQSIMTYELWVMRNDSMPLRNVHPATLRVCTQYVKSNRMKWNRIESVISCTCIRFRWDRSERAALKRECEWVQYYWIRPTRFQSPRWPAGCYFECDIAGHRRHAVQSSVQFSALFMVHSKTTRKTNSILRAL